MTETLHTARVKFSFCAVLFIFQPNQVPHAASILVRCQALLNLQMKVINDKYIPVDLCNRKEQHKTVREKYIKPANTHVDTEQTSAHKVVDDGKVVELHATKIIHHEQQ